jgi:hypothetical protein
MSQYNSFTACIAMDIVARSLNTVDVFALDSEIVKACPKDLFATKCAYLYFICFTYHFPSEVTVNRLLARRDKIDSFKFQTQEGSHAISVGQHLPSGTFPVYEGTGATVFGEVC